MKHSKSAHYNLQIEGYEGQSEENKKLYEIYRACKEAGISLPRELEDLECHVDSQYGDVFPINSKAITFIENDENGERGYVIEVKKLDPSIKFIKFFSSPLTR